jgi:AcrR family transcriptional regulator
MTTRPKAVNLKVREEVASLKRERTIDAAADLFYQNGYANTTLDAVAELLGVTKPFIYANFGSKSELLAEICARGVAVAHQALRSVSQDTSPIESLKLFGQRYVTAVLQNQKHIAIYVREEKNLDRGDARRIGILRRAFFGEMSNLLERGIVSGDFSITNSRMAALAIGGAVTWTAFWYRADGPLTLAEIAESFTNSILGIAHVRQGGASRTPGSPRADPLETVGS